MICDENKTDSWVDHRLILWSISINDFLFSGLLLKVLYKELLIDSYLLVVYPEYYSYTINEKRYWEYLQYFFFTDFMVYIYYSNNFTPSFWLIPVELNNKSYPYTFFNLLTQMWLVKIRAYTKRERVKCSPILG